MRAMMLQHFIKNVLKENTDDTLLTISRRVVDYMYVIFDSKWHAVIERVLEQYNFGDIEFHNERKRYAHTADKTSQVVGTINFSSPQYDIEYRLDWMIKILLSMKPAGGYTIEYRVQAPIISRYNFEGEQLSKSIHVVGPITQGVILTSAEIERESKVQELFEPLMRQILQFEEYEQI